MPDEDAFMYLSVLRELEKLQAELAKADPADATKAAEIVGCMAGSLRRLDTRDTARQPVARRPANRQIARRA